MAKVYRNRFASMEKQPNGTWLVYNEVLGFPVHVGGVDKPIRVFKTYDEACGALADLCAYYSCFSKR